MKMKHLFIIGFLLCMAKASAKEINALCLHLATGKQITCLLDEKPVVTFRDEELIITTHLNQVAYKSNNVLKFTYTYIDPSGIMDIEYPITMFKFGKNSLQLTHIEPSSKVELYTVDGILVVSSVADANGNASLSFTAQSGTVYIVKTAVANFKITKP
ncbi:MAG: hypothetical protein ACI3YX_10505 [Prevotella sp.]